MVIRMRFECPETRKPLFTVSDGQWSWRSDELMSMHCPKCSKLHSFGRAEAVLTPEPAEPMAVG